MTSTLDQLTGTVRHPGDPGYATAAPSNDLAVVHQPPLVVEARDAADVAAAVRRWTPSSSTPTRAPPPWARASPAAA